MEKQYEYILRSEHYVNSVDYIWISLSRTCLLNRNTTSIWISILSSSRAHHNVDLGEVAAAELLKNEPSKCSNYAHILNIYGEDELWDRAAKLRAVMKEKGVKKKGGCSWIEVRNRVHVLCSADS
ncbi:Pentatricopeptide repeat-containing protein At2g40720 [Linum grandiflorum]